MRTVILNSKKYISPFEGSRSKEQQKLIAEANRLLRASRKSKKSRKKK